MAESLPAPPTVEFLRTLGAELHVLPIGTRIWRVYFASGAHPSTWDQFRWYGPTNARFDHHDPPKRVHPTKGILYGADLGRTSLAEVFQRAFTINRTKDSPHLAAFDLAAPLSLLDVTGGWITRAKGNMAIASGSRNQARAWSRTIYEAYPDIQGIRYASSVDSNQLAVALYERAIPALPAAPTLDRPLTDPALQAIIAEVCDILGYAVV